MLESIKLIFVIALSLLLSVSSEAKLPENSYGVWLNLWNYPENTQMFLADLERQKINTIYLQLGRSNTEAIKRPERVREIIKAAKEKNIKVIGWFYAYLEDPSEDAQKFVQGASFEGISGMAVDLEENVQPERIILFTETAREALGETYPLTAITYSPLLRPLESTNYPWKTIAERFEVIAPMLYWHKKTKDPSQVYALTSSALADLKELIENTKGRTQIIQPIGDSHETSKEEVKSFVKACLDQEVNQDDHLSLSLYPYHLAQPDSLQVLPEQVEGCYLAKD